MNTSELAQRRNSRFFFTSVLFAVGLAVASGFFVKGMFSKDLGGVDTSTKSCLAVMRTNGFSPVEHEDEISVDRPNTTNVESLVYKSGVIIATCPAYTLKDYCAGAACKKPGVSFTLKKKAM